MLTVVTSLKAQQHNILDSLAQSCRAARLDLTKHPLLPLPHAPDDNNLLTT
jgi:hypothetical protein